MKIGFIGCGAMGEALLKGIIDSKFEQKNNIFVTTKTNKRKVELIEKYEINIFESNIELVNNVDVIFLATKPNSYKEVIDEVVNHFRNDQILISITPSFSLNDLNEMTDHKIQTLRTLPNTPSMVGLGMTGITFNVNVLNETKTYVLNLFNSFGRTIEIEEKMLPILSSMSGSGPAFVYLFMDSLMQYGIKNGFTETESRLLVSQTLLGSAKMVINSNIDMDNLISNVCSKGGSTIEGVNSLKENNIYEIVNEALNQTTTKFLKMMVK